MKKFLNNKIGFSLVEVIVATSVILIFLTSLIGAYNTYLRMSLSSIREVKATFLIEETTEAVKLLRDTSWSGSISPLAVGTPYRLSWNGSTWVTSTSNIFIENRYDRTFTLSEVFRDSQGKIVTSGGTLDSGIKKATISVSWSEGVGTSTKILETYVSNIFSN